MPNPHAATLREMVETFLRTDPLGTGCAEIDACRYGAQCIAIVERLADIDRPHIAVQFPPVLIDNDTGSLCRFCGSDAARRHEEDCIWQQAKRMTTEARP